jgi:predicted dehydrogenase
VNKPIDVAVVGCGHMGNHHARTVAEHPDCRLIATVDSDMSRASLLAERYGSAAHQQVPDGVDAVIVATNTYAHEEVAMPLLKAGRWCLVEKPLALTPKSASAMLADRLAVGHIERFNPAIRAAGLMKPRYVEALRLAPPTGRSRDTDVIFDLMIHDLDLMLNWAAGEIEWIDAVGLAVEGEQLDTCSVRMRWECGLTASLVASRVSSLPTREVRVFEEGRYTFLDMVQGIAKRNGVAISSNGDSRDALTAQLDDFVAAIRGEKSVAVTGASGVRAVTLAERIRSAVKSR